MLLDSQYKRKGGTITTLNAFFIWKDEVPPFGISILEANVDITTRLSRVGISNNQASIAANQANIATNQANIETNQASITTNQANIETNRQNLGSLTDAYRDSILRFHAEGPGLEKRSNLGKVIPLFSYLRCS